MYSESGFWVLIDGDMLLVRLEEGDRFGPYAWVQMPDDVLIKSGVDLAEAAAAVALKYPGHPGKAARQISEAETWAKMGVILAKQFPLHALGSCTAAGACGQ